MKPKVFVTRKIPEKGLAQLRDKTDLTIWPGELPPLKSDLLSMIKGMDGLLCLLSDPIDREVISAGLPTLKVISNYAVGFDNIDVSEATQHGIPVGNTPDVLTDATADFTFALLMAVARRIPEAILNVKQGHWKTWGPSTLVGADFVGTTLGLIGFGRIGQAVARRAAGFSMNVVFFDPTTDLVPGMTARKVDTLDELLEISDFVSLHVPLTKNTYQMVNAQFLSKMKANAILVNTARGAIVDQQALCSALREKRIAAAALDVTVPEPLPVDDPLLTLENCLITPHIASAGHSARDNMADLAARNLLAGLHGEPLPSCVNPGVYN